MEWIREFLGIGGYTRDAVGYFSPTQILFAVLLCILMVALAVFFGRRGRGKSDAAHNRFLLVSALVIDGMELFKAIVKCAEDENPAFRLLFFLPLFLCTMQMVTIPLAAVTRGRVREACLDFIFLFGLLGAVMGIFAAGNIYSCYPLLSLDVLVSGFTHAGIGMVSLYIPIAGISSMKKKNIWIVSLILALFGILAYVFNLITGYNYMFLMRGDGTPYDLLYQLFSGDPVLYPLSVMALFYVFMGVFYLIRYACTKKRKA